MLDAIVRFYEKTGNINRSTYIWNALNAGMSAAQCPVILMVMTRVNGVHDAGIFSIAFAVACLMLYVAQYGLRRYQSSDIKEKFTFREYHGMRFITCIAMIIACIVYCFYCMAFKDYDWEKFSIVFMVCMLKCIQGYADVIHGHLQQKGRLDVAAKASATRYFMEIVAYIVALIITGNLFISTVVCLMVSLVVLLLTSVNVARKYCDTLRPSIGFTKFKMMFIEGFPLFISLFLNTYICNAPKYAIDTFLTEELQAFYNIIFMPAMTVQLIAHFIFNPVITTYAKLWLSEEKEQLQKLIRMIKKQCYLVTAIAALGIIVALTIGIPVLSFIFGVDLGHLKWELTVIMIGGGMLAFATYFSTIITVIRLQNTLFVSYGIVALIAKLLAGYCVVNYSLMGAAWLYAGLMFILALMLFGVTLWGIGRQRKKLNTISQNKI